MTPLNSLTSLNPVVWREFTVKKEARKIQVFTQVGKSMVFLNKWCALGDRFKKKEWIPVSNFVYSASLGSNAIVIVEYASGKRESWSSLPTGFQQLSVSAYLSLA